MKYLVLDKTVLNSDLVNKSDFLPYKMLHFSGGEPHIQITKPDSFDFKVDSVLILHRLTSMKQVGELLVAVDALRNMRVQDIKLFIAYFPGGRQDRALYGEAFTCRVFAKLINSLELSKVVIIHPHSDVTPALLTNSVSVTPISLIVNMVEAIAQQSINLNKAASENLYLVSPDAGAAKFTQIVLQNCSNYTFKMVICSKSRNMETGELSGFEVHSNNLEGSTCIIVDDLCDGGGTFIGLGEELRNKGASYLGLVITHGIFSKGFLELGRMFDSIACTNSFSELPMEDLRYVARNFGSKHVPKNMNQYALDGIIRKLFPELYLWSNSN